MAAVEMFESVLAELSNKDRQAIADSIRSKRVELLAARSEDARLRIVAEYQREVRDLLTRPAR